MRVCMNDGKQTKPIIYRLLFARSGLSMASFCVEATTYKFARVNVFNVLCGLLLFVVFFSSSLNGGCLCCCSNDDDDALLSSTSSSSSSFAKHRRRYATTTGPTKRWQGTFHRNTERLRKTLFGWNWLWFVFEIVSALESVFEEDDQSVKDALMWSLITIKAIGWFLSLYMESYVTLFVIAPVGDARGLEGGHKVCIVIASLAGAGSFLTDVLNDDSNTLYYWYDFGWSALRFFILSILAILNLSKLCDPKSGVSSVSAVSSIVDNNDNGGSGSSASSSKVPSTRQEQRLQQRYQKEWNWNWTWLLFMVVVYALNSTQEYIRASTKENVPPSPACLRMVIKSMYFGLLSPVLLYATHYNNKRWNRTMAHMVQEAAADWVAQHGDSFTPTRVTPATGSIGGIDRKKNGSPRALSKKAAVHLQTVRFSPLHDDFLLPREELVPLDQTIGTGSYGVVQLYHYKTKDKRIAVKFVKLSSLLLDDTDVDGREVKEAISGFKQEFAHFVELHTCDHVVRFLGLFFELGASGPKVGVAMEYCERGSLFDNLPFVLERFPEHGNQYFTDIVASEHQPPWPSDVNPLSIGLRVAQGLQSLHEQYHYLFVDLKPANIVLTHNWEAKLVDLLSLSPIETRRCCCCPKGCCAAKSKATTWTVAYASPELIASSDDSGVVVSIASDVYSFGIVLWHLVTGHKYPFVLVPLPALDAREPRGFQCVLLEFIVDVREHVVRGNLRPPLPATLPPLLSRLIQDCWATDPTLRPTMANVVERLNGIIRTIGLGAGGGRSRLFYPLPELDPPPPPPVAKERRQQPRDLGHLDLAIPDDDDTAITISTSSFDTEATDLTYLGALELPQYQSMSITRTQELPLP